MKYEITKGSEKDFEGAPEGCTKVLVCLGETHYVIGDKTSEGITVESSDEDNYLIAERRPFTEPVVNQQLTTEWDGAGIAHLGQHVEYFWGEGKEWRKAEVVAHYEEWPLLKDIEDGLMVAELNNTMRPIRSPEDVARDEVIANICFAIGVRPNNIVVQQTYDAIAAGKTPGITLSGK